jgi:thioredoxin-dependent peroxiredoxin
MRTVLATVIAIAAAALAAAAFATPKEGAQAPAFRLQDQNNEWHALEDYSGRWLVLYFYPKADTPGCTTEACEFRDNIFAYEALGAAIVGVSLDDVASQAEFAEKYSLPFPLLSDAQAEVAGRYGVLTRFGNMEVASRQTFLIAPDGRIARHYERVDPETHATEVLADLRRLM